MRTISLCKCVLLSGLLTCGTSFAADNCSGYDTLVAINADTIDLGKGHTLTAFRQYSMLTSENSSYNLHTGECAGAALTTPDGKTSVSGYCARRDNDGDSASIEFALAPGAEKGTWKSAGGTGKYAGKANSGWFQDLRSDGKMSITKWGGTCK